MLFGFIVYILLVLIFALGFSKAREWDKKHGRE